MKNKHLPVLLFLLLANFTMAMGSEVVSLTLVNSNTNTDIVELTEGDTIDLAVTGSSLNIRADISGTVGSVVFGFDGNSNHQTENAAPYTLEGDNNGNYNDWTPSIGNHTITATPYSESGGSGIAGVALTLTFVVVNQSNDNNNDEGDQTSTFEDTTKCGTYFEEKDGMVVVEIESAPLAPGWEEKTAATGFTGSSYYEWTGGSKLNSPGYGLLEYKIKISTPGEYRFVWHSNVEHGTSSTESNDSWLRVPDADNFYALKKNDTIRPKGVCTDDCPNGSGKDGWLKVYSSGSIDWTWSTNTSDNDGHQIYASFNNPGIYTVQISGRSEHHALDRFILSNGKLPSESERLTVPESSCDSEVTEVSNQRLVEKQKINIYPSVTNGIINIDVPNVEIIRLFNLSGNMVSVKHYDKQVDLTGLNPGTYILRINNQAFKIILLN